MKSDKSEQYAVDLVQTYLRLNGFFTTRNFTMHCQKKGSGALGDIDIFAIHLPGGKELVLSNGGALVKLPNDSILDLRDDIIEVVIAEVKTGGDINHNWNKPAKLKRVATYVGRYLGVGEPEIWNQEDLSNLGALRKVHVKGVSGLEISVRIIVFCEEDTSEAGRIQLDRCADFVIKRFGGFCNGKPVKDRYCEYVGLMRDVSNAADGVNQDIEKARDDSVQLPIKFAELMEVLYGND